MQILAKFWKIKGIMTDIIPIFLTFLVEFKLEIKWRKAIYKTLNIKVS